MSLTEGKKLLMIPLLPAIAVVWLIGWTLVWLGSRKQEEVRVSREALESPKILEVSQ